MADYERKDLDKHLKNYISQLQGKNEKEQLDYLLNTRDKRTKEIKAENPTVEVQYHPELDALGMLYQSVSNGHDPKLEYEFDDEEDNELYNQMESMGDLPSDMQLHRALKKADTNNNGEIEKDEMADFQKSLDDYAAKNKKGREDIPATYKR